MIFIIQLQTIFFTNLFVSLKMRKNLLVFICKTIKKSNIIGITEILIDKFVKTCHYNTNN